MWKLTRIVAQNLCAFRELDYHLRQGVPTLIFGDNRDNESQRSNGSGKSALIECIAIGITGSPLRKIRNEEIINDNSDDCYISLEFANTSSDECFWVEREIYRNGPSVVRCRIERGGETVRTNEAVQSSVDAYNRYILEKLGLTREEVLNNFILSKYRYQEFLSSSDREKKEIINRFSNGILVDEAIEKVEEDMKPIESSLKEAELELAGIDGRIDMLCEQITSEQENREEKTRSIEARIVSIRDSVAEKRNLIRNKKGQLSDLSVQEQRILEAEKTLQSLENGNAGLEECAKAVSDILAPLVEHKPTDWNDYIATKQKEIDLAAAEIAKWETIIAGTSQKIGTVTADLLKAESEFRIFNEQYGEKENGLRVELSDLEERIVRLREGEEEIKRTKRKVSSAIEVISSKLAGAVSCPACGHEFMVSEAGFDVEAAREQLEKQQKEFDSLADCLLDCEIDIEKSEQIRTHLRNESRALTSSKSEWEARMAQVRRNVQAAEYEMEGQQFNLKRVQEFIAGRSQEIADARRKVFDEAFGMIDERGKAIDREKSTLQEEIQSATSAIDTLQATIEEMESTTAEHLIESLKESLKQYRMASADALTKKAGIEECLRTLEEQREYFVQFKTYLANTKIEALSKITNEFLENIGSDIRIRFSGYTVLKTGKVREKISVSLIRDGVDCGSFGKFSAGEAARVNLATILAMQKLINSNCDTDKGLDLLVLDEILEAVDEDGLSFMFGALQNLGVTSLVVSHGNIAESYPYKIMVVKENGESRLEQ